MTVFAKMSKEALIRRRIWVNSESSVFSKTINIINCARVGASLITKQGAVKKKKFIFVSTSRPNEQNGVFGMMSILKTMFEFVLTQLT